MPTLKGSRGKVAELFLSSLAIVKEFDVFRDLPHGLSTRFILPMKNMLRLQRTPETFHGRVVVAVALATHGGLHPELLEQVPERMGTVLAAAIRMMQQSGGGPFGRHRPEKGLADQMFRHTRSHGIADDLSGVHVLMTGQVEPPLLGRDVCDIAQPDLPWSRSLELLRQQVFRYRQSVPGVGRHLEPSLLPATQAEFLAQALDPVNPDMYPVGGQVLSQSLWPVCFPRASMGGLDF